MYLDTNTTNFSENYIPCFDYKETGGENFSKSKSKSNGDGT